MFQATPNPTFQFSSPTFGTVGIDRLTWSGRFKGYQIRWEDPEGRPRYEWFPTFKEAVVRFKQCQQQAGS